MPDVPSTFGPYVLLKSLGTGGGGDVFLAKPRNAARGIPPAVVIKRLHGSLAQESDFVRRFRHEAEIAVTVTSPHLVKCYDAGVVGEMFYIAMEYVAGWTLQRLIRELQAAERPASLDSVRDIVGGALKGLEALHNARDPKSGELLSIVHRDIAPKNIMVGEDGVTRLIDLGIGKSSLQDWRTGTGVIMGSPGYMAPEQVAGEKIDRRVDVYGMGIVLWELLTLRPYFERTTFAGLLRAQHKPQYTPPSKIAPGLPPALDGVCARALAADKDQRFATAGEMLSALYAAIPQREEEQPLATVISEMLLGELGQTKTEVFRLLSERSPAPLPEVKDVVVFAHRAGVGAAVEEENLLPTLTGPMHEAAAFANPYAVDVVGPPKGGVPLKVVLPLLALTLLLGIAGTAVVLQNSEEQVLEAPIVGESAPKKAVVPAAVEAKPVEIEQKPAPEVTKRPVSTRSAVREDSKEVKSAPPIQEQTVDPHQALNALIARVRAVRVRASAGSAAAQEATRLMTKLSLEGARPELDSAAVQRLDSEVRVLEAL